MRKMVDSGDEGPGTFKYKSKVDVAIITRERPHR